MLKTTLILLLSTLLFSKEKIVLNSMPNSLISEISIAILKEAYKKLDIEVERKVLPEERALKMSNSGAVDGEDIRVAALQPILNNLIMIPIVISSVENCALSKDSDIKIDGWESLRTYSIATVRGIKIIEKNTEGFNRKLLTKIEQCFYMLEKDRVDIIIYDKLSSSELIKKKGYKGINILEPPLLKVDLYHYLHKKNIDLVDDITSVLESMKESGEFETIRKNYLLNLEKEK